MRNGSRACMRVRVDVCVCVIIYDVIFIYDEKCQNIARANQEVNTQFTGTTFRSIIFFPIIL